MKRDISVRAGVVLQLTLIAVASLSLQAVFALKAVEITIERRQVEAAVSVAELVRSAVESRDGHGDLTPPFDIGAFTRVSPYIREVALLPDAPPGGLISVLPVGEKSWGILSVRPAVDVTLPISEELVPARAIRVRFYSPGAEREAAQLVGVAGLLVAADIVAFVLFGFFLMERSVVRPIRRLAAVAEKIAAGDYRLRADELPKNEVGQLGGSFNRMVEEILSAQERVRQAEHEAFRAEKLASVGRLAAGVAHEVGSPLMAVRGYAEYLRKTPPDPADASECLQKIVLETRKIEDIVRGLLSVVAPGGREDEHASVNAVVRETVDLLSFRRMFRDVAVSVECGDVDRACLAPGKCQQVLLNLLLNAVDAMENRGVLRVRTFRAEAWVSPEARRARRRASDPPGVDVVQLRGGQAKPPAGGVAVSVSDTGCGIRPDDIKNIFDPFFTTKEPGKGTGLGLSVSRAIVEGAGGEILVKSEQGKGSTFTVILPACEKEEAGDRTGGGADA